MARQKHVGRVGASTVEGPAELSEEKKDIQKILSQPYKWGFKTIIESDTFPKGLSEDVVRAISAKKDEPEWMLEFRLKAYKRWLTMEEPKWSDNTYPTLDYQVCSSMVCFLLECCGIQDMFIIICQQ